MDKARSKTDKELLVFLSVVILSVLCSILSFFLCG